MMWHWSWYGWLLMSAMMIAFWATVAYLVAGVVGGSRRDVGPLSPDTPEAVLAQRLARGDIDDDEYRRRMATLGDRPL